MTSEPGQHGIFLVPERRARSAAAIAMVDAVRNALAEWARSHVTRKRGRRPEDQRRHDQMVEALVCNAIHVPLLYPGRRVAVSLSKAHTSRYLPRPYAPMKDLLTHLSNPGLGFLKVTWGGRPEEGRGTTTTYAATPRLRSLAKGLTLADFGRRPGDAETIILRNTKARVLTKANEADVADAFEIWAETRAEPGDLLSYGDNPIADQLRDEMRVINTALDEADLTFDTEAARALDYETPVDVGDRWLRRGFNNGLNDMSRGGRLAGGFWMGIDSDVRLRTIRIGGEAVVELDFSAMMPRLLYALHREPFPIDRDPYAIEGLRSEHREGIKKVLSALLYGATRFPRGCQRLFPGIDFKTVMDLLRRQHHRVAHEFGARTMIGFQLLRTESNVLVRVLRTCLQRGFVCLPVHDAVLCPTSRAEETERIMVETFQEITGAPISVRTTYSQTPVSIPESVLR